MQSAITDIKLDGRTYHNVSITPTLINFFFGKNGVGKSTIADNFAKSTGLTPVPTDYDVLVFDKEFIARNIREDDGIPGVFSVNEGNIRIEEEIKQKEAKVKELREEYSTTKSKIDVANTQRTDIQTEVGEICWKSTKAMRDDFPLAMKKTRSKKENFVAELLSTTHAQACDLDELATLYSTAFNSDATQYQNLVMTHRIEQGKQDGYDLLNKPILSSADTPFADFIRTIGATDWVRHGNERFSHVAGDKCPYCNQILPDDYAEQLASCFDAQYDADIKKLQQFTRNYEVAVDSVLRLLNENLSSPFPRCDFTEYKQLLDTITAVIELNKKNLNEKLTSPASTVTLSDFDDKLDELNAIIDKFNSAIQEHNAIIASRADKKEECIDSVWKHMAFLVEDEVSKYRNNLQSLDKESRDLELELQRLTEEGTTLSADIVELSKQIVNIDSTMNSINKKLDDSGFQGFKFRKKQNDQHKYEIVRDDGSPGRGLSEGERNFLAFLYFYHKVQGRESAESTFRDRIVVIDDPVSSMDSSSLFIVSSIVRELMSICYNNGYPCEANVPQYIKQMFILTHNAFFHKEVSYHMLKHFRCVNFYLIKKARNVSTIELCVRKDPLSDTPAYPSNFTPVTNSYTALWKEYKEVTSPSALLRVVRQILEYYFIQISGYESQNLTERIMADEGVFCTENEDGTVNRDLIFTVSAMLRYIGSESTGFNDGLNYVEGSEDIVRIRETFERIFTAMEQRQHYKMMIETS